MVNVNEDYVKDRCLSLGRGTQERKMTGQVKKSKDLKEDEERLKRQEKKENRKYLHFIFNLFDHYTVLKSSF